MLDSMATSYTHRCCNTIHHHNIVYVTHCSLLKLIVSLQGKIYLVVRHSNKNKKSVFYFQFFSNFLEPPTPLPNLSTGSVHLQDPALIDCGDAIFHTIGCAKELELHASSNGTNYVANCCT